MTRAALSLLFVAALGLSGCGRDDLPRGPDFASLEAPFLRLGLDAFRRGDAGGVLRAADGLDAVAQDVSAFHAKPCSRDYIAAREAKAGAELLRGLAGNSFITDSEDARFVVLGQAVGRDDDRRGACDFDGALRIARLFLPGAEPPITAAEMYYASWRAELSDRLGTKFDDTLTAAQRRVGAFR
jgi:hypothetical protein